MNSIKLLSLGLWGFNVAMLLGHCAIAYPSIRLATILLLLAFGLFSTIYLGMGGLFVAMRARGQSLRRSDATIALGPAMGALMLLSVGVVFGVYTGS